MNHHYQQQNVSKLFTMTVIEEQRGKIPPRPTLHHAETQWPTKSLYAQTSRHSRILSYICAVTSQLKHCLLCAFNSSVSGSIMWWWGFPWKQQMKLPWKLPVVQIFVAACLLLPFYYCCVGCQYVSQSSQTLSLSHSQRELSWLLCPSTFVGYPTPFEGVFCYCLFTGYSLALPTLWNDISEELRKAAALEKFQKGCTTF